MAPPSLGSLSLGALLIATSYAIPIAPGASLAERGRCKDENGFIVGTLEDCSQLVPAITLPPVGYVWRRDGSGPENLDPKVDSTNDNNALVYVRDEYTHIPASHIFIAKVPQDNTDDSGAGLGSLPPSLNNDKTSGSGQGQPWSMAPEPKTIGVTRNTLPVEKPVPMTRRLVDAGNDISADLAIHRPAHHIYRRDDRVEERDRVHSLEQDHAGPDTVAQDSAKSEVEQLFQQSKSAGHINTSEAKLTIMRLAQDLYRRGAPDAMSPGGGRSRVPFGNQHDIKDQSPGGDDMGPVNMGRLVTLYPTDGVYRRSQNIESVSQNVESSSQVAQVQTGKDNTATVKNLHDALAALTGKGQLEARGAVAPNEDEFLRYRPRPVYDFPTFYQRDPGVSDFVNDIKDKLNKLKSAPSGDSGSGGSRNGGDSASGGDTAKPRPGQADSKSSSKKRSAQGELKDEIASRSPSLEDILGLDLPVGAAAPAAAHGRANEVYRRNVDADVLASEIHTHSGNRRGTLLDDVEKQEKSEGHFAADAHMLSNIGYRNEDVAPLDRSLEEVKRSIPAPDEDGPEPEIAVPSPNNVTDHTPPAQQAYDDALAGMRAALTQFIELCKNPVVLEHLETDSVEKCQSKVRKALKHVNSKDSTESPALDGKAQQVEAALNSIFARDTNEDEKEQKKADRETDVSLRAWQKYQDTCGGLLAFACEPKCAPSDPWPCIPQPAWAHQPTTIVQKRGYVATPGPKPVDSNTASGSSEVPGKPKHLVLDRKTSVFKRTDDAAEVKAVDSLYERREIDPLRVDPLIPTPSYHKTDNTVFRRGADVHARRQADRDNSRPGNNKRNGMEQEEDIDVQTEQVDNDEIPKAEAAVPWYHRKVASIVEFPTPHSAEEKKNGLAARKIKPSPSPAPSPRPKPKPTPTLKAEPKPILPDPLLILPTPMDYKHDSDLPKNAVSAHQNGVYKPFDGDKAHKRSADVDVEVRSIILAPEDVPRNISTDHPPKYAVKVPANSVYKPVDAEGEGVEKRELKQGGVEIESGIVVEANLPIVLGVAGDVHRRDGTFVGEEGEEEDEGRGQGTEEN